MLLSSQFIYVWIFEDQNVYTSMGIYPMFTQGSLNNETHIIFS